MRIDLPLCSFGDCKYRFDGNCAAKEGRREGCEFRCLKAALYSPDGTELITLDRLRELVEADRDGPLTLEELRQMDKEPVWVEFDGDEFQPPQAHWCFVQAGGNQVDVYPCDIHEVSDWSYYDTTFAPGGGARAYREKPKEDK